MLPSAVNLSGGEILYWPVFGSKFGSKKEAMQDFVASFLFRSSAAAKVLHVQLATPIVKCEPVWKLTKNNVALMFNHKRSHPRTLAACGTMSIMMFFNADYTVITINFCRAGEIICHILLQPRPIQLSTWNVAQFGVHQLKPWNENRNRIEPRHVK